MANPKYKYYGADADGNVKLINTESHPKLDASQADFKDSLEGVITMYSDKYTGERIDLTSDTTVFTAA